MSETKVAELGVLKAELQLAKAQVKAELASKISELDAQKAQLQEEANKKLAELDAKALEAGLTVEESKKKRGRPRKDASAETPVADDGVPAKDKRVKNETSWKDFILGLLKENKGGLKIEDITKAAVEKGLKTTGNVGTMVYQTLYRLNKVENLVERNEDVYTSKEAA